jgi:hypothetical protein
MLSLLEIFAATDAFKPADYAAFYERFFEPLRARPLALLELGIHHGGSLRSWEAYFPYARIAGIDRALPRLGLSDRVRMFAGDQADKSLLSMVAADVAPEGFDIVIDDCAHLGSVAKASFWYLFEHHLKPGGLYCIEDWGTGFIADWDDGHRVVPQPDSGTRLPSHDAGLVGFIKQLIDELGAASIKDRLEMPAPRASKFAEMALHRGICVVRKEA